MKKLLWLFVLLSITQMLTGLSLYMIQAETVVDFPRQSVQEPQSVVSGWNNSGMHRYNPNLSNQATLPPYNCHGTLMIVAQNPGPWLNEPKCSQCHAASYDTDQPLYRQSAGHGGIFREGCHDSIHAIAPSREVNAGIKFVDLQGI